MITKQLTNRTDSFNRAIITKYFDNGVTIATLQQIETDKEGVETIVKSDVNISFPAGTFEFTEEEMNQFKPVQNEPNLEQPK